MSPRRRSGTRGGIYRVARHRIVLRGLQVPRRSIRSLRRNRRILCPFCVGAVPHSFPFFSALSFSPKYIEYLLSEKVYSLLLVFSKIESLKIWGSLFILSNRLVVFVIIFVSSLDQ